jgi:excisionase family DNA binding protein
MIDAMKIGREEAYTLVEAGKIANLSPNTLRAQIKNGVLPATLAGKTYLVRAKDLTRYIEKHRGNVGRPRKKGGAG